MNPGSECGNETTHQARPLQPSNPYSLRLQNIAVMNHDPRNGLRRHARRFLLDMGSNLGIQFKQEGVLKLAKRFDS
jgi:hypothetical protein